MKKLALVGSHPGTRDLVPWDDAENYDIWTINESATMQDTWVKRTNGIFQLHPRAIWDNPNNKNDPRHGEWLKANTTVPVFMLEKYPDVPMAEKYPLEEITDKYLANLSVHSPRGDKRFYSCTVAYMCALAMWKGYTEVDIYGVELSVDSEYRYQRPGASFWVGLLSQHAKVRFFGRMLDAPLYGYEAEGEIGRDYLIARLDLLAPKRREMFNLTEPKRLAFEEAFQRFYTNGTDADSKACVDTWQAFTAHLNGFGIIEGAGQELENRVKEIDKMLELDKDFRFSHHGFMRTAEAISTEMNKVALHHAHLAGAIDFVFAEAVNTRLMDSRRKALLDKFHSFIPPFVQDCQKLGIYQGALRECQLLAGIIVEQKEGTSANNDPSQ